MSQQTRNGGSSGTIWTEWTGIDRPFNSSGRQSFTVVNPTFPSNSTIVSVQGDVSASHQNDVDGSAGFIDAGLTLPGGAVSIVSTFINASDSGGCSQNFSRPGGGSWTFSDIENVETYLRTTGGSGSTCHYNSSSITVTFTLPTPTATTSAATNVTVSGATLNGTINPTGANASFPVSYKFEWGLTTSYGNTTTVTGGQTGSSDIPVSANISGLVGNTLYHFRVVALNADVTTNGSDQTFTTLMGDAAVLRL